MNIGFKNNNISSNGLNDIYADDIYTQNLYINNSLFNPSTLNSQIINQPIGTSGTNNLINTNFIGNITQPYSNTTSELQNLTVNNNLNLNGSVNQTSGSTNLNNLSCQTLNLNSYITQNNTSNIYNTLEKTTITDLIVSNSLQLPSNIQYPTATYTNANINMTNGEIIQTDISGNIQNQFIKSDFIEDVYMDGNFTMTNNTKNAIINNLTLNNQLNMNGSISQSTGTNNFLSSNFTIVNFTSYLNNISPTTFNYIANLSSDCQSQLTNLSNNFNNYVLISTLNNTLLNYVLNSQLTTELNNYVLNSSLTTELNNYVLTSTLNNTLLSYVTNNQLTTELNNYVLTSTLNNTLLNYITNSQLTTELNNYVLTSTLNNILLNYVENLKINKVTTNTLSSGSNASVSIIVDSTSTPNNQLWDFIFNIPQGATGPQGPQGPQGPTGATPSGSDILSALGISLSLTDFVATIAAVAIIESEITTIQGQITAIDGEITAIDGEITNIDAEITNLNNKTTYQSISVASDGNNSTNFTSEIRLNNTATDSIILNPYGDSSFVNPLLCNNLTSTGNINLGVSTNLGTNINGSSVNIISPTINLTGSNVNITGLLTINGYPFYNQLSYFNSQSGYFQQL